MEATDFDSVNKRVAEIEYDLQPFPRNARGYDRSEGKDLHISAILYVFISVHTKIQINCILIISRGMVLRLRNTIFIQNHENLEKSSQVKSKLKNLFRWR